MIQILHDAIIKADYMTVTDYVPEEEPLPIFDEEVGEEMEEMETGNVEEEEIGEEVEEEAEVIDKYKQILWRTCVPFEVIRISVWIEVTVATTGKRIIRWSIVMLHQIFRRSNLNNSGCNLKVIAFRHVWHCSWWL